MIYKVKGDKGHPFRLNKFIEFHKNHDSNCDLTILRHWCEAEDFDTNLKIWTAFIYSACKCAATTMVIVSLLPLKKLTPDLAKTFWEKHEKRLLFSNERKFLKHHTDWFLTILNQIHNKMVEHDSLTDYINCLIVRGSAESTYAAMQKEFSTLAYFGKFAVNLLIDSLYYIVGVRADTSTVSWRKADFATSGMMILIYKDEESIEYDQRGVMLNATQQLLISAFELLRTTIADTAPEASLRTLDIAQSLRNFRKLFKQLRYIGYWLDIQLGELYKMERNYPELADRLWAPFWESRNLLFEPYLLGESTTGNQASWKGVRKDKTKQWYKTGEFK